MKFFKKDPAVVLYSFQIINLSLRLKVEPKFVFNCFTHPEDGRFQRLFLFASLIEKNELTIQDALSVEKWSLRWIDLLLKARPKFKNNIFAKMLNENRLLNLLQNDVTELEKLLVLFEDKKNEIFAALFGLGLEKFTEFKPRKLFNLAKQFSEHSAEIFSHFIEDKNFLAYTKETPLITVASSLDIFPSQQEKIYQHITASPELFLRFADKVPTLNLFLQIFPDHKEDIFNLVMKDECFKKYYNYGHFFELHELNRMFQPHEREIIEKAKEYEVPHLQSFMIK